MPAAYPAAGTANWPGRQYTEPSWHLASRAVPSHETSVRQFAKQTFVHFRRQID